jgi:hypothetical protein
VTGFKRLEPGGIAGAWAALVVVVAGCSQPLVHLAQFDQVQQVVITDSLMYGSETRAQARPPVQISHPDQIAAFENFLQENRGKWRVLRGDPRTARFELKLIANGRPLSTFWLENGFLQVHEGGKKVRGMRLSASQTADLLAALGLPPDFLA